MKTLWNIISYINLLSEVCAVFESKLYTHSDAEVNCKGYGGLYSNKEITKTGYIMLDSLKKDSLYFEDGDSAWISGYVEYSDFISWQGCYKEVWKYIVIKYISWNYDIISCLKMCYDYGSQNITHIGIRRRSEQEQICYCLTTADVPDRIEAIDISECNHQDPYSIKFNYTGSSYDAISVYRIFYQLRISNEHSGQCLLVKPNNNNREYFAPSCYTKADLVSGFICVDDYRNKMNRTCDNFSSAMSTAYCLQNNSVSWINANKWCKDHSGKLSDDISFQTVQTQIPLKEGYWTGMFRSFKVKDSASRVCLAVTKVDNKLVLDPDDCSKQKQYICTESQASTVSTWKSVTSEIPVVSPTTEDISPSTDNKNNKYEVLYIALVVLGLVTVLGAIVAYIAVRCFRKRSQHKRLQETLSAFLSNECEGEANVNVASVDNAGPTLQNSSMKVKPKKPERNTLRKKNIYTPYENYKLKSSFSETSEKSAGKESEDYDVVDLKSGKTKLLAMENMDESHVYNHTTDEENSENYDTIKSAKLRHQLDCVTYSTLQRKADKASEQEEQLAVPGKKSNDKILCDEANDNAVQGKKSNEKILCDEANDNAAFDAVDGVKAVEKESVHPTEDDAEKLLDDV